MTAWVKEIREDELAAVEQVDKGSWKRYVSLEPEGRGMIFGMGRLEPGEEVSHLHPEEELFYTLEGHGEATWIEGGHEYREDLHPGVAFYKTSDISHCMRNTGTEPLIGIFFKV